MHIKIKLPSISRTSFWSLLILPIIFLIIFLYIENFQRKSTIEVPKNEMKIIPADVKKKISEASPSATFTVPVLMYHYVEYVADRKDLVRISLNVNPNIFENQLETLKAARYTFLTAKDLADILDGKQQLPNNPILLTFDDGHWDFETNVLPLLKKYHIKATAYIISGFIGGSDFMSKDQLNNVIKSRIVEIGAHTIHHIALKGKLYPIVLREVEGSKKILEDTYHIKVDSFAYPSGSFDQQSIQIVKNSGFKIAVSTIAGEDVNQNNRFFIFRLRPGYRTGQSLISYLKFTKRTPQNRLIL